MGTLGFNSGLEVDTKRYSSAPKMPDIYPKGIFNVKGELQPMSEESNTNPNPNIDFINSKL
jgi:hypothetical protein